MPMGTLVPSGRDARPCPGTPSCVEAREKVDRRRRHEQGHGPGNRRDGPGVAKVRAVTGARPPTGLTSAEAATRLAELGPNEVPSAPPVPLARRVLAQLADPMILLLI